MAGLSLPWSKPFYHPIAPGAKAKSSACDKVPYIFPSAYGPSHLIHSPGSPWPWLVFHSHQAPPCHRRAALNVSSARSLLSPLCLLSSSLIYQPRPLSLQGLSLTYLSRRHPSPLGSPNTDHLSLPTTS